MPTHTDGSPFASVKTDVELSDDQVRALAAIPELPTYGRCIFVTGRAGTGKSTVLRKFAETTTLRTVVLAPTGLAAIQVGGQTIHSFFNLPLGPLEDSPDTPPLFKKGQPKRRLMEALECVVIDEVSMVRADVMDAIDWSLRINRDRLHEPFGGVTLLCFGDLMQLEPVVTAGAEQQMLADRYASPYFFDSRSAREASLDVIELTTFHRQKEDQEFLWALNRVREGFTDEISVFNERVGADIGQEGLVTLTATNARATTINQNRLTGIKEPAFRYEATVTGDFGKDSPAERTLTLKRGAQVMFIKNGREWANGSLGAVTELEPERARVRLFEGGECWVGPEDWEKKRYKWDNFSGRISSEPIGTFRQIPLKLAWAITIHKSQGLTLDKAVIDLDRRAFAYGQTYVALSRCRTLSGISLIRALTPADVSISTPVENFLARI